MIGKVLFTIGVILVVALIWRTRRPRSTTGGAEPRLINPAPQRRWPLKGLAIGALTLMLLASALLLYDHWRDSSEVIYIRVVDASSGRSAEYQAARGDIGDRVFVTTEGRRIVLAETERLETSTVRRSSADRN
ncbi:MAG: hypothetical protein QNJ91_04490 [Gammaproteobacteria bacterium]|nr:hypothetical protein [Gammaproteobacteria bacterium]